MRKKELYYTKLKGKLIKNIKEFLNSRCCKISYNKSTYAETIEDCQKKIKLIDEQLNIKKKRMNAIQNKYKFEIPDYILDEIIEQKERNNNENLISLINLAVVNKKLTKENGEILKNTCQNKKNNV